MSLILRQGRKFLYKNNDMRCTTNLSHTSSKKSNNLIISNSDNVIVTSNLPHSNNQNDNPFSTLNTLQKFTYKE